MAARLNTLAALTLVIASSSAGAQAINRAATGLASPSTTITFEGQTPGSAATNQYAGQGVTFGSGLSYNANSYFGNTGGARNSLDNFSQNQCCTTIEIFLSGPVQGSAFQFITNSGTSFFNALLGGTSVYSFSATTDTNGENTPEWYGFDNTITFDQIEIVAGGYQNQFALDNLELGSVVATPEPASLALLATGLVALAGVARRRNRNA